MFVVGRWKFSVRKFGWLVSTKIMKKLTAFLVVFFGQVCPFGLPAPSGVFNQLVKVSLEKKKEDFIFGQQAEATGLKKSMFDGLSTLNSEINSPDGRLVAIKFTLEKELKGSQPLQEVGLSPDLKDRARLFYADYRLFVDFLHSQVYRKVKVSKLDIPSVLFFRSGGLELPIEPWELSSASGQIEDVLRSRLDEKELKDDDPELFFLSG